MAGIDFGESGEHVAAGLLEKPHRPYLNAQWPAARRLTALRTHYQTVSRFPNAAFVLGAHSRGYVLVRLHLARGDYQVVLRGCKDSREGELELALEADSGLRIVSASFAFIEPPPVLTVAVGCLQGGPASAHEGIAILSKAFHGIPVKLLIVKLMKHLVALLASPARMAHLVAIDDEAHVFRHWRYRRKDKVSATYATTWRALGGKLQSDGFWAIPVRESPPDYARLKSSKRSLARHRWEDLQLVNHAMEVVLAGGAPLTLELPRGQEH